MPQLVWFRNDLRVADNPALVAACQSGEAVEACFFVTPDQWQSHDLSPARAALMLDHVEALGQRLAGLGIPLHIVEVADFEASLSALETLVRDQSINTVHINEEYGVNERRRDKAAHQRLRASGVTLHKYRDQTVAPVGAVLTGQDQPYSVFTPFSRRWWDWVEQNHPHPLAIPAPHNARLAAPPRPATPNGFGDAPPALVRTGEDAAHDALQAFLEERGARYKEDRDFPAVDGTSLLSPYLASGILSGRQCLQAGLDALRQQPGATGIRTWLNEICWRDFYVNILYHFPRVSMHRAFKPETEALTWNDAGETLTAWQEGRTGIPIVDAAMRQLRQTGWMHNRLRMVAAMFLSKNLFLDWRLGEAWFMRNLADGYLASNNGGWQWSASTGTDAAPYFRVFNPATQSERFDPRGDFIRQYVPELRDLDNKRIHNPAAGGTVPKGYVRPIVDLKSSRKEAIARFQALKD
ncbi:deoxyribodipyrimidine photo-lyase [Marinobacter sp. JSM 1782161]|uniref:deoxyribodipyrimidine photo-lyase n=1 Tax=Marinobacter sp. JSM 1782161 TaxID=2685906 RepID=UPI0014040CB0|nr:deoxyribodipyrimidine photo-lyase [Marinobacter sp. JSM 1782161]